MGKKTPVVHSVSVAEFDIDEGNTLSASYPAFTLEKSKQDLANLCLPDGAHLHEEDITYLVLREEREVKKPKFWSKSAGGADSKTGLLYGVAVFRSVRDDSVRRGAVQKSMLLLTRVPYFHLFIPILRAALVQLMDHHDDTVPKQLFNALSPHFPSVDTRVARGASVSLWGSTFSLDTPLPKEDVFGGASLLELVTLFGTNTMVLWYAMLLRKRVLFCGMSGRAVGNSVLAAPLLVAPVRGYAAHMSPYVSLYDLDPITSDAHFVAGSTNQLFETKSEWYDVVGLHRSAQIQQSIVHESATPTSGTGPVSGEGMAGEEEPRVPVVIKLSGGDRRFIKSVLAGITDDQQDEKWVRDQFAQYTVKFLSELEAGAVRNRAHARQLKSFASSPLYARYLATKEALEGQSAMEFFDQLGEEPGEQELSGIVWNLDKHLTSVSEIEDICDRGGVARLSALLSSNSAQVRKYSVSALAKLTLSIKGQIGILTGHVMERVVAMLADPMPNVRNAAVYCVLRISHLSIGVHRILRGPDLVAQLSALVCSPAVDLVAKAHAVSTLVNVYGMRQPTLAFSPEPFAPQFASPDPQLVATLFVLFDTCTAELPPIPLTDELGSACKRASALAAASPAVDPQPLNRALLDIMKLLQGSRLLRLEFVSRGGVELLRRVLTTHRAQIAYALLAMVADTHYGRQRILGIGVVELVLAQLRARDRGGGGISGGGGGGGGGSSSSSSSGGGGSGADSLGKDHATAGLVGLMTSVSAPATPLVGMALSPPLTPASASDAGDSDHYLHGDSADATNDATDTPPAAPAEPLHATQVLFAARLCQVLCERTDTCRRFHECCGALVMVQVVLRMYEDPACNLVCLPALLAVRNMLRVLPNSRRDIASHVEPLKHVRFPTPSKRVSTTARNAILMVNTLNQIVRVVSEVGMARAGGPPPVPMRRSKVSTSHENVHAHVHGGNAGAGAGAGASAAHALAAEVSMRASLKHAGSLPTPTRPMSMAPRRPRNIVDSMRVLGTAERVPELITTINAESRDEFFHPDFLRTVDPRETAWLDAQNIEWTPNRLYRVPR